MEQHSKPSYYSGEEGNPNEFKNKFTSLMTNAMSAMTHVYAMANQGYEYGYLQGKKEAYKDVFKWLTDQHDNTLRYVSTVSFFHYINNKIVEVKSTIANRMGHSKFEGSGASSDDQMSDGISKLEKFSDDVNSTSIHMKSSIDPSSSSHLKSPGVKETAMMFQENRKRRRNPFLFGKSEEPEIVMNSELPPTLRPENNQSDYQANPFLSSHCSDEQMVHLPKRKKTNL
uniref:Uncharacterized protein n=1 Tax=Euplotes crassus TaxID=5936 RepID=A0A7S3K9S7_EUPCR|mmetsp:Transcript_16997/g.16684  ORF Transcript_16997/g.16684 Transcript_16997/m.16684 type:complete len:228 (+) Transcript_16997:25-708(+)